MAHFNILIALHIFQTMTSMRMGCSVGGVLDGTHETSSSWRKMGSNRLESNAILLAVQFLNRGGANGGKENGSAFNRGRKGGHIFSCDAGGCFG